MIADRGCEVKDDLAHGLPALKREPNASGRVTVGFVIGTDGTVLDVHDDRVRRRGDAPPEAIGSCARRLP